VSSYSLKSISACLLVIMAVFRCLGEDQRKVTVADVITMTHWVDLGSSAVPQIALFSPDHRQFVVLVKKGNLARNTNDYSLLYFQIKSGVEMPQMQTLVTMSSSSTRDAIRDVRWLDDNRTVTFLGENPGQNPEVYSIDVQAHRLRRLTDHPTPIVAYDIRNDGRELVFEAVPACTPWVDSEAIRRNGVVIESQYPSELLEEGCPKDGSLKLDRELYVQFAHGQARKVPISCFLTELQPLSLSPDGRYAVLIGYVGDIPSRWSEYEDNLLHPYLVGKHPPGQPSNIQQYMLLDVKANILAPLVDGPRRWQHGAIEWTKDGHSVIVSGTYLPYAGQSPAEVERRQKHAFVAEVHLPDKKITEVTDQNLEVLRWDQTTGRLLLTPYLAPAANNIIAFERSPQGWRQTSVQPNSSRDHAPTVTVEEDLNTPPQVFIQSLKDERKTLLLDLNPRFSHLLFGKVEALTWKASDGHLVNGGLYLPPDYQPGRRYPLVIQTHGFNPHEFWMDGPFPSAFAAQPLAAKDIVVLQVGNSADLEEGRKFVNTTEEGPRNMAAYEGAIDELDRRGLIDRNRVGIIGFSRTVFHAEYALTHSHYRFRAASLTDGFDASLMNYFLWRSADYIKTNGGDPLTGGLDSWIERSPGFAIDKVTCPVHLEYYGLAGVLGGWQWFASLELLKKPVDFLWLPRGKHTLILPWERHTSLETNVDWFAFWLNHEIDPSPAKAEQYKRWQALREQSGH
jgi:dipeptidyl aminopeptidase/acylaminoacyl peptidase